MWTSPAIAEIALAAQEYVNETMPPTRSERAIARLSNARLAAWLESLGPSDSEIITLIKNEQGRRNQTCGHEAAGRADAVPGTSILYCATCAGDVVIAPAGGNHG